MRRLLFLGGLAACGRVSFDPRTDSSVDGVDVGPADPSLLVHYKFDDDPVPDILDSSGHNHHGTCLGGCPDVGNGLIDQAYSFDGTTDGIQVGDLRPAKVTLSAWVLRGADTPAQNIISKPFGPTDQNSWQLVVDGNSNNLLSWCSTQQDTVGECAGSSTTVAKDTWHHVAYTHDGTRPRGFLDGVEFIGTRPMLTLGYDAQPILIAADFDLGTYVSRFNGRIDDVRIYDRALSAAEVQRLAMGLEP